jgi:threonine synthase
MKIFCPDCGRTTEFGFKEWHCSCGGAWELAEQKVFDRSLIASSISSLWRYEKLLPIELKEQPSVSLGAGWTLLMPAEYGGRKILFKLEYRMPTASFKDRGVEVMMSYLHSINVRHVVEDSSGNAGASVAAYAARTGIKAEIYTPAHASKAKLAQIAIYGAKVHTVAGTRIKATQAVMKAVKQGAVYASHAYHPVYLLAQQTAAWEVWEQLGYKTPDWYVVPVGQGGKLLGIWLGFRRLLAAGLIEKIPRLVAVQPALIAPLCEAFNQNLAKWPKTTPKATSVAKGLAITKPVRWKRMLQALRESNGKCIAVSEEEIMSAHKELAKLSFYVEPTSAVVVAALPHLFAVIKPKDTIVISLTGSGLKSPLSQ